jgi:hypothetical protein
MTTELTSLVRKGTERACVAFTADIAALGFQRTRKMFWARVHEHSADVLHIHRGGISYGAPISASVSLRLHLAIRVLNDSFPAIALNGPSSDTAVRYHLRFNARSFDLFDRCVHDLVRYVRDVGEPWFALFREPNALLLRPDSPLQADGKAHLQDALAGRYSEAHLQLTQKELGLERTRKGVAR